MIGKYRKIFDGLLPLAVFAGLWCLLIKHLSAYWAANPQYGFGWFGPLVCAYLFFIRWVTKPPAGDASSPAVPWLFWIVGFALLPTWLIEQPNPDSRLVSWMLSLEVVGLSLCAIYFLGGRTWLRHFAFSICFILTTLPWPAGLEMFVTQSLMQASTWVTVALLHAVHISALQHGNIIELKTGLLGIDEACSGVRSLQATLMVSLFLGALYRASTWRRTILVLSGVLIAYLCNVGRTFFLCWVAAKDGTESISKWHDPAGFVILTLCFFTLWGVAHLFSGSPVKFQRSMESASRPIPRAMANILAAWLVVTLLGTEIWYRAHETGETLHWSFELPAAKDQFSALAVPEDLGDERRAASWTESDGSRWTAFFFKWDAGPPGARILARLHRPENCLPAAGYKLRVDRGMIAVKAKELTIPFHAMEFDCDGQQASVFYCLWQDRLKSGEKLRMRDNWDGHLLGLESVLLGERNLGQQTLEIVIFGYDSSEQAEDALRRQMENLIRT
jgi:exosortase